MQSPPAASAEAARLAYLDELDGVLWPGADTSLGSSSDTAAVSAASYEYFVLPDRRGPRLLLPTRAPAAAAAAVRGSSEPRSALAHVAREGVALTVRSGVAERLLSRRFRVRSEGEVDAARVIRPDGSAGKPETIEAYVAEVLGDTVLSLSLGGQRRANRKPVLQVLRPDGTALAFVKLGTNDLTNRLVHAEHEALLRLSGVRGRLPNIGVADVLQAGTWHGAQILVQSCLPVRRRGVRLDPARVAAGALEVARAFGTRLVPLASSTYLRDLQARLQALLPGPEASVLQSICRGLSTPEPRREVLFGASHGDWTPWNMAQTPERLLVWDWERFTSDAPVGVDAVHFAMQERTARRGTEPRAVAEHLLSAAPVLLRPLGVHARNAELVVLLYLIDIGGRYLADSDVRSGARLAEVGQWLLPLLSERTSTLGPVSDAAP